MSAGALDQNGAASKEAADTADNVAASAAVPAHIALIMDGNGRWAAARGLQRLAGHQAGTDAVKRVVAACIKQGVDYLTLYSFSTENWHRPPEEVNGLMSLFAAALSEQREELQEKGVRLRVVGDLTRLPEDVLAEIEKTRVATESGERLQLTLAVSYGAREEILHASRLLASRVAIGELDIAAIDESSFSRSLWTAELPDPDLLIRSSGELRVSNFLLWQIAYSEIVVRKEYWPDFDEQIIAECIREYAGRERRFGKTSHQLRDCHHS